MLSQTTTVVQSHPLHPASRSQCPRSTSPAPDDDASGGGASREYALDLLRNIAVTYESSNLSTTRVRLYWLVPHRASRQFQQLEHHSDLHILHSQAWQCGTHCDCPRWLKFISRSTTRHAKEKSLTDIIWVTPSESHLQVVVLSNHRIEFPQQIIRLIFG